MGERGQLFLLDRKQWDEAVSLGLGQGITYLILARGTDKQQSITSWLAKAIEKHTGIGRKRAAKYIDELKAKQLVKPSPKVNGWPRLALTITDEPEWVFLPNTIVDGAAGEVPPLERIRRRGSVEALKMLIDAYAMHDLANDDGLDWRLIRQSYTRSAITERGNWAIWGFNIKNSQAEWGCPLRRQFPKTTEGNDIFWKVFEILTDASLIEAHPYLVEGLHDGAELIFPLDEEGTEIEQQLFHNANDAARVLLGEDTGIEHRLDDYEIMSPVSTDWPNAQVVGIYRLRYRPKTKATAFWYHKQLEWERFADSFGAIVSEDAKPAENCQSAPSKIVQRR